jgi:formate-dependent nitrite reductase cytochrome c552 subunit
MVLALAKGPSQPPELVEAQPPPFTEGIFPCSQCHDPKGAPPNGARRELAFHSDAAAGEPAAVFDHDSEHRWCLDCHDLQDRDLLRLASGATVPFAESYRLCGQCHGDKFRDWRLGVHGKRIGRWDGKKTYFLCVNCHNPHTPRFKGVRDIVVNGRAGTAPTLELLKPEPRPLRPREDRR